MELQRLKNIISLGYVVTVVVAGILAGVTSGAAWVALTAAALLPAGALLCLWTDPAPTMSERIQTGRR